MRSIVLFLLLAVTWFALSGYVKPFFIAAGVLSCLLTLWIARRMDVIDREGQPLHMTLRAPIYWLWLAKEMVVSSVQVARRVLARRPGILPAFGWIDSTQHDPASHATYANSITLTPGTVAINILVSEDKSARIYVHALEKSGIDALQEGSMQCWVQLLTGQK